MQKNYKENHLKRYAIKSVNSKGRLYKELEIIAASTERTIYIYLIFKLHYILLRLIELGFLYDISSVSCFKVNE